MFYVKEQLNDAKVSVVQRNGNASKAMVPSSWRILCRQSAGTFWLIPCEPCRTALSAVMFMMN